MIGTHYMLIATWITCMSFLIAFMLTFLHQRPMLQVAGALFSIGTLAQMAALASRYFAICSISSDSKESFPVVAFLVGIWALCYGFGASALLLPRITQRTAIALGTIVHITFLMPLLLFFMLGIIEHAYAMFPFEIGWLAYPLLWFRIREAYGQEA